jgi:hypothetical protein
MKRFEQIGEAYLFWIRGGIKNLPEDEQEKFKSKLINRLKNYEFISRKKDEPLHPNSVRNIENILFNPKDTRNPEDAFEAILIQMHPYYVSGTQNKIKDYIIKNL